MTALEDVYAPYRPEAAHPGHHRPGGGPRAARRPAPGRAGHGRSRRRSRGLRQRREERRPTRRPRWPARATSSPSGSATTPTPARGCAQLYRDHGSGPVLGRAGQGGRGRQVQGLLRLDRAARRRSPATACWPSAAARRKAFLRRAHRAARGAGASRCSNALFVTAAGRPAGEQVRLAVAGRLQAAARRPPWRARSASRPRRRPTPRRSGSSPTTSRQLLLAPPLGQKRVLGDRPGLPHRLQGGLPRRRRASSCTTTSSTRPPRRRRRSSRPGTRCWRCVDVSTSRPIAIGNGTASRETEAFVRGLGAAVRHRRRDRQRERRLDLLGQRGRARGVPRPGRHRARRGVHRAAARWTRSPSW